MNAEEIKKIVSIMMTADNDCADCASRLMKQLNNTFPGFEKEINEVWISQDYPTMGWKIP
jgi:hypothetical protein